MLLCTPSLCIIYFSLSVVVYPATIVAFRGSNFLDRHHVSLNAIGSCRSESLNYRRSRSSCRSRFPYSRRSYKFVASSTSRTQLRSMLPGNKVASLSFCPLLSDVFAACSLLFAAWMGFFSERQLANPLFPSCGIIISLFVASLLPRLFHWIPTLHPMYDACWSTILPASLALLLLSLPSSQTNFFRGSKSKFLSPHNSILIAVRRLGMPFLFACLGSILGCSLSYVICCHLPTLLLTPFDACKAAACLVASYIGGSVNFLATAAAIVQLQRQNSPEVGFSGIDRSTLMSAMCATDILVMAIYFAVLSMALHSRRLQRWFYSEPNVASCFPENYDIKGASSTKSSTIEDPYYDSFSYRGPAVLVGGLLALFFVELSKRLESFVNHFIPGTACGFLCVFVPYFSSRMSEIPRIRDSTLWKAMQHYAEPMSLFLFLLLFGSIGITTDVSSALSSGPACLFFSLIAMATHGIVALFGSFIWNRVCTKKFLKRNDQIDLADVLIASNAAIGGPATAAAFCGQLPKHFGIERKRSLSIAGTVWGVVGYAFGTTIGVSMYRLLQNFV